MSKGNNDYDTVHYSEARFEVYRALIGCAVGGVLPDEIVGEHRPSPVQDWFQCLSEYLLSDNRKAFHPTEK